MLVLKKESSKKEKKMVYFFDSIYNLIEKAYLIPNRRLFLCPINFRFYTELMSLTGKT